MSTYTCLTQIKDALDGRYAHITSDTGTDIWICPLYGEHVFLSKKVIMFWTPTKGWSLFDHDDHRLAQINQIINLPNMKISFHENMEVRPCLKIPK